MDAVLEGFALDRSVDVEGIRNPYCGRGTVHPPTSIGRIDIRRNMTTFSNHEFGQTVELHSGLQEQSGSQQVNLGGSMGAIVGVSFAFQCPTDSIKATAQQDVYALSSLAEPSRNNRPRPPCIRMSDATA